jgi:hypothetical protein
VSLFFGHGNLLSGSIIAEPQGICKPCFTGPSPVDSKAYLRGKSTHFLLGFFLHKVRNISLRRC